MPENHTDTKSAQSDKHADSHWASRLTLAGLSLMGWAALACYLFWAAFGAMWSGQAVWFWVRLLDEPGAWFALILFGGSGVIFGLMAAWPRRSETHGKQKEPPIHRCGDRGV